jgi:hypothetical protein
MILRFLFSIAVPYVLLKLAISPAPAAEPIAEIRHFDAVFSTQTGNHEFNLLAVASLTNVTIDGFKIHELSGLAWDEDENLLYALSDNGYLLHLRPVFENSQLTDVLFIKGYSLQDKNRRPLRYRESDSEGIAVKNGANGIKGDSRLIISFERAPRLIEYGTDGVMIAEIPLPAVLADIGNYQGENKSLEAVAIHERFGVITGPEYPLAAASVSKAIDIYSLDGNYWSLPVHNPHYGALVGMTVMPDGGVLALERAYGGIFPATEITLHRIVLEQKAAESEIIYTFSADNGLLNDNFEGVTRFREDTYFMISDDNNHPLKKTLLVYFSITRKHRNQAD